MLSHGIGRGGTISILDISHHMLCRSDRCLAVLGRKPSRFQPVVVMHGFIHEQLGQFADDDVSRRLGKTGMKSGVRVSKCRVVIARVGHPHYRSGHGLNMAGIGAFRRKFGRSALQKFPGLQQVQKRAGP